jgi:uncharacterized protein YjbJ (UPF0337 family)
MNNEPIEKEEIDAETESGNTVADNVSGIGQMIIGEIQSIGGIITGDPTTRAEGEFNVAVGEERDDVEEELEDGVERHEDK